MTSGTTSSILSTPISQWKEVTELQAQKLAQLQIYRIGDLITHLPKGWEDRTSIVPVAALVQGSKSQVFGIVQRVWVTRSKARRGIMMAELFDKAGHKLQLMWFNYNRAQLRSLQGNPEILCFGEVKESKSGVYMMSHPQYERVSEDELNKRLGSNEKLQPFYRTIPGFYQPQLRRIIGKALNLVRSTGGCSDPIGKLLLRPELKETLLSETLLPHLGPEKVLSIGFNEAIEYLHDKPKPSSTMDLLENNETSDSKTDNFELLAKRRLALDELVSNYLVKAVRRTRNTDKVPPSMKVESARTDWLERTIAKLPFTLTNGQLDTVREIILDMEDERLPMRRLLQGDVGSGKTIVAILVAVRAVMSDCQVAILAPTEVLIDQHERVFQEHLAPLEIETVKLTSSTKPALRKSIQGGISNGKIKVCLGTHALLEPDIEFSNLGLLIVDEQHRFGVDQRLSLVKKGEFDNRAPNQLAMTATPIPRTLAMTLYADMDVSNLKEMPAERAGVQTTIVSDAKRKELLERVDERCQNGDKAYWVCPLIEESEVLYANAAISVYEEIKKKLSGLSVGLLHGQMKSSEKQKILEEFRNGNTQLLVSTTVVEVGVDVRDATIMVIENPERFGLAQLHQLRGRVGRGSALGHCVLLTSTRESLGRLRVLCETTDGFEIAEADLKFRGSGELWGTKQHGGVNFKVVEIERDSDLLKMAMHIGKIILQESPREAQFLIDRWLGNKEVYTKA